MNLRIRALALLLWGSAHCAGGPVPAPDGAATDALAFDAAGDGPAVEDVARATYRFDVQRVGTEATLDVVTWNLRMFPSTAESPAMVAQLLRELDVDLVALQEVLSPAAFDELLERLPGYAGVLSEPGASPLRRAFVYRTSVLSVTHGELLLSDVWRRAPFLVTFEYRHGGASFSFDAVCVHATAFGDAASIAQRTRELSSLETALTERIATGRHPTMLVLGDWNQGFFGREAATVWGPFLGAADRYTIETRPLALSGEQSHLGGGFLDHLVASNVLHRAVGDAGPVVIHLKRNVERYDERVSDHLPVTLRLTP